MPKIRPAIVVAAAFATAAVAAVGVGMVALNSIGTGLGDRPVQPVAGAGANPGNTVGPSAGSNPAVSPSTSPTASPRTSGLAVPDGPARTFDTPGGVIVARCIGRQAYLVSWSPNPGFRTDDVDRGPAAEAEVEFSSDTGEVEATIVCASGTATIVIEENEHGGGGRN